MFDNDSDVWENVNRASQAGGYSDGLGGSPDGLGAYAQTPEEMADPDIGPANRDFGHANRDFNIPSGGNAYEPGEVAPYPYGATAGTIDMIEPEDTSPEAASRSAGFTVLLVALSTGIGYAAKGGLGAATGLLLSGALANGYRAQKWWNSEDPSEKHEAIVSGIFAAGGVVAGGYIGYRAMQEKK